MSQANVFEEGNNTSYQPSCASLVIEHRVTKEQEKEFYQWQDTLTNEVSKFKGYLRTDLSPPVMGAQEKWYVIVYFDESENLNNWIKSPERQLLVKEGKELFGSYKFRSFKTGLESWFITDQETEQTTVNTPAWKQNLLVLLGLYPTVMLQTLLLSFFGLMKFWPLSVSMLINNFICCSILTWVVIPPISQGLAFWLRNKAEPNRFKDLKGLALITVFLLMMMIVFYTTYDSDPATVLRTLQAIPKSLFT